MATGLGPLGPNKALTREFNYDPHKDLDPISLLASFPNIIVTSKKLPVTTFPRVAGNWKVTEDREADPDMKKRLEASGGRGPEIYAQQGVEIKAARTNTGDKGWIPAGSDAAEPRGPA